MFRDSRLTLRAGGFLAFLSIVSMGLCLFPQADPPRRGDRFTPVIQSIVSLSPKAQPAIAAELYGDLPLSFELVLGEAPANSGVRFAARGPGYWVGLSKDSIAIAGHGSAQDGPDPVEIRLLNARTMRMEGTRVLPGVSNYYFGSDPSEWRTGVSQFTQVEYHGVYDGVDAVFYGTPRHLEFDFVVAPHADPAVIQMEFGSDSRLRLNESGDLMAAMGKTELRLQRPLIYQEIAGERQLVAGGFTIEGSRVGFRLGDYDRGRPLVIDPVLYSGYLGGSGADVIEDVLVDADGNILVVGSTQSPNFPTVNGILSNLRGASDGFITKLNPAANTILYSTYLGGNGDDTLVAVAVDPTKAIWVAGSSNSNNFPLLNQLQTVIGAGFDSVAVHISPAGLLQFSSYMGGNGDDFGRGIALDAASSVYVVGDTFSTNLPVGISAQPNYGGGVPANCPATNTGLTLGGDAFVYKMNSSGSARQYTTYLGGSGCEAGRGIAVDAAGNAYITGATNSANFPTSGAVQASLGGGNCAPLAGGPAYACPDAFVVKLNSGGTALVYSTYLGGNSLDDGTALAVDGDGAAYITGATQSGNFPTANALKPALSGTQDAFIAKMAAGSTGLVYSTYYGGTGIELASSIRVDAARRAFFAGNTSSGDLPLSNPVRNNLAGGLDAFAATLGSAGSGLSFSSYFGTSSEDQALGLALDSAGAIWLAGYTDSNALTVLGPPLQANSAGGRDGFLAKFSAVAGAPAVGQGGVVNNASFAASPTPMAPGSIAAVFGTNLNDGSFITSSTIGSDGKLVTTLGGASVTVNNIPAPIFYSTPTQIGIQIPFEMNNLTFGTIRVTVAGETSAPQNIPISNFAPGIFTANQAGTGIAAALHENVVTPVTVANPARLNEVIVFYGTGLGITSPPLANGERAGLNLTSPATATVAGVPAIVEFSGAAPGFVGLNQINVRIPSGIATGQAIAVVFTIGGQVSNTVTIPIAP